MQSRAGAESFLMAKNRHSSQRHLAEWRRHQGSPPSMRGAVILAVTLPAAQTSLFLLIAWPASAAFSATLSAGQYPFTSALSLKSVTTNPGWVGQGMAGSSNG